MTLRFISLFTLLAVFAAGCDREEKVVSYRAPKEKEAPKQAAMIPEGDPVWTVPAGWTQKPGDEMRYALFATSDPGVMVSVSKMGPQELLANVNRWERQIKRPETSGADLPKLVKHLDIHGNSVDVVDLLGPESKSGEPPRMRTLGALLTRPQNSWVFKLTGPGDKVEAEKANFDTWLASVEFKGANEKTAEGQPAASTAADGQRGPWGSFVLPSGWKIDPTPKQMRAMTLVVGPADQPAEVIVSRLSSGFGDMKSNVDRWRGMVGLDPIPDPKNQKQRQFTIGGQPGVLFDFEGPKGRMFVALAVLEQQQTAWFFKFQGTAATVAQQEPTFEQFLSSVQFGQ